MAIYYTPIIAGYSLCFAYRHHLCGDSSDIPCTVVTGIMIGRAADVKPPADTMLNRWL